MVRARKCGGNGLAVVTSSSAGNLPKGDDLKRGSDNLNPPNDLPPEFVDADAKLSDQQGVSSDMSSLAINGPLGMGASSSSRMQVASIQNRVGSVDGETFSDADVMLRVKGGDDDAFNYLVNKYRRAMIGFMYRMVHNSAIAEELAQEVFLRVYRSREGYSADAKFTTWLYRIATNLAVNHARDTKYERPELKASIDEPDEETGLSIDVADKRLTAEQQILRRERMAAIRSEIESLPERQRLAVLMHKYQNLDYKQIAEALNLSESATKSLLFRAYESLREKLKKFI